MQIAKLLTADKVLTVKAYYAKKNGKAIPDNPCRWSVESIRGILERPEYTGCTVNFKPYSKSRKLKKRLQNAPKTIVFFPTHKPQLLIKMCGNGYRNYGQTSAAPPSKRSGKGCPLDCSAAPIAEVSCTLRQARI